MVASAVSSPFFPFFFAVFRAFRAGAAAFDAVFGPESGDLRFERVDVEICTIGGVLLNEEAMWNKNNDRDQFMTVPGNRRAGARTVH